MGLDIDETKTRLPASIKTLGRNTVLFKLSRSVRGTYRTQLPLVDVTSPPVVPLDPELALLQIHVGPLEGPQLAAAQPGVTPEQHNKKRVRARPRACREHLLVFRGKLRFR